MFVTFWGAVAASVAILIYAIAVSPNTYSFLAIALGVIVSVLDWIRSTGTVLFIAVFSWKGLIFIGFSIIWHTLYNIEQILLDILRKMYD